MSGSYPKRLIEVDLPIKEISKHARREKSRGPISMLHIWWTRRPLGACRAVLCASLWPDPGDDACPPLFHYAVAAEQDARFWKLAQSLSALYPAGSDEKRWVDGVLARKKGLGS